MEIQDNRVVQMHYTLKDDGGSVIDTSDGKDPLTYMHAEGSIIPGLFRAITGKKVGEKVSVVVKPDEGYGHQDDNMIQQVPRDAFKGMEDLAVGVKVQAETEQGIQVATVTDVKETEVTIDLNHPLAGVTLHFDVEIVDIREATEEEISHGHVHGPGGHQH
ncbi:MAG: peptidylprolyl isomerase [Flavobacteriales bacterium]|nr:peptidylprolyl isomerase [Flavobacteriales bacterium]